MIPPALHFTAATLAAALDKAPRTIRRGLDGVPHSSVETVNGGEAKTWALDALPKGLREELTTCAKTQNFRDAAALLQHHGQPTAGKEQKLNALRDLWSQAADSAREKAIKLQRALLPALGQYDAGELAGADLEQRGLDDYARHFGRKKVSARTWRFLFQRTRERARTPDDYQLPHLFLDENCPRRRVVPDALNFDDAFGPLHAVITSFGDPLVPTPKEQEALWFKVCKIFQPHEAERPFKRGLLEFLWNFAPALAESQDALRVNFGRKYARWNKSFDPQALADGRRGKLGVPRAAVFLQSDLDTILGFSLFNCGARLSQGVRELRDLGDESGLSREMRKFLGSEFLGTAPENKSYVPQRLREAMRHELAMLKPHRIGPRAADGTSAWLQRDWSAVPAMFAITMDDLTGPVYFWTYDQAGKVILTRGQILMAVDCRSLRVLGFSIQCDRNYNSRVIRTLITKTCAERGLPKVFYLERGIWLTSKLIKGNALGAEVREAGLPFSWPECEHGLLDLGVKFIHAIRPRSKLVERVFGLLQDRMEGEPGYCGREERKDRPEHLAKQMYAVEHGEDPSKWFYSFEQWEERLHTLCETYNADRQCGEILQGQSPNQAFESCQDVNNPPEKFGADCRYLLAHQKISKVVGNNGVTLTFGKEKFVYRDAQTGALRGQTVLCWFDPDAPDQLVITDLNRRNPICVERAEKVLPFDDESEHFRHEMGKAQAHSSFARARYRVLKVGFREEHRRVVPDRAAAELGQQIEQHRAEHTAAQRTHESLQRKAARLCEQLAMPLALARDATPEQVQGWEDMLAVQRESLKETT